VRWGIPASRSARVSAPIGEVANGDVISCDAAAAGSTAGRFTHAPPGGGGVAGAAGKAAHADAMARWRPAPNGDIGDPVAGDDSAAAGHPGGMKPAIPQQLTIHCVQETSTFYFVNNCQKLTDFNDFWHVKSHSVAEWLACWTQAQKGPGSNRRRDAVE